MQDGPSGLRMLVLYPDGAVNFVWSEGADGIDFEAIWLHV